MLRFLVFADLHYKKGMYASTVEHLETILARAKQAGAEFVIHLGDLCNDYAGSPELTEAYLHNRYNLPVFGIYGNHELETRGNTMENVTPLLCNADVTFGKDGAGYWHYDISGFRLIGLDTNYSYNAFLDSWQHNAPASWGAPDGNLYPNSLGPEQLIWLDEALEAAKTKGLKALVFSHAGLSGEWESSPDSGAVHEIFSKYRNTVLMSLNGHLHTDRFCVKGGVAYFDVNTVLNGCWQVCDAHHYSPEHTFTRESFAPDGSISGREEARLDSLTQAKNTWFFKDPLSAIVDADEFGIVRVTGSSTSWKHGIVPPRPESGMHPYITDSYAEPHAFVDFTTEDGRTGSAIEAGGFSGDETITGMTLPEDLVFIGEAAFMGCTRLASIRIPGGVTGIQSETFFGCRSLMEVQLPNSVTSVGPAAFMNCMSLPVMRLPRSTVSIGPKAFANCRSLRRLYIPAACTHISADMLENSPDVTLYVVPDSPAEAFAEEMRIPYKYTY